MDHLSSSQITLYLQCPRKYKLRYVDEIQPPFKPVGLAFGSAVHSAIAYLAGEKRMGKGVNIQKLISIFRADWEAQKCDKILFNGEGESEFLDKGISLLQLIHEEAADWKVKAAEMPFRVPVFDPETGETIIPVPILGFIDLLLEPNRIVEIKTGVRKWTEQAVESNLQLTLYAYAYKVLFGKDPDLEIKMLLRQRNPRTESYKTSRSKGDVRWALELVREVFEGIEKKTFFPNPGWFCGDCEYGDLCKPENHDEKGGNSNVE